MKYRETLSLESDQRIDPNLLVELGNLLKKSNIDLSFFDAEAYCWEKCKRLILEKGTSYILSVRRIQEEVLPKVEPSHKYLLVQTLRDKLKALSPSSSLIIVDPYLFPTRLHDKADFIQTFQDILAPVIRDIRRVDFVTKSQYNQVLSNEVKQLLSNLNPKIAVVHTTTDDFHDRFWIADEQKGLFVGTSLNGIGKRYALTDYIRDEDTQTIVNELRRLSLIG